MLNIQEINLGAWGCLIKDKSPYCPIWQRCLVTESRNQETPEILENKSKKPRINLQAVDLPHGNISWHEGQEAPAAHLLGQALNHSEQLRKNGG